MSAVVSALLAGVAVQWLLPWTLRGPSTSPPDRARWVVAPADAQRADARRADARLRILWSVVAGAGITLFVSGPAGLPAGALAASATWVVLGRTEPTAVRRAREAAERDLPGLVHLLAAALQSGCATGEAVRLSCEAYPGPAADLVSSVSSRLALGIDVEIAWQPVLTDARLAVLGRTMVRAHRSGASVASAVAGLADELGRRSRLGIEERARAVGVKAAVPLGLCLLPSFVLLGVVPLAVSLMQSLAL
jgi:Flp pilus assembly protein TadB